MSKGERNVVLAVVGGLILISIIIAVAVGSDEETTTSVQYDITENESEATSTPIPSVSLQQIYNRVQNGMTKEEVRKIAGREPDSKDESDYGYGKMENWTFYQGSEFVSISFTNGQVDSKSKY